MSMSDRRSTVIGGRIDVFASDKEVDTRNIGATYIVPIDLS